MTNLTDPLSTNGQSQTVNFDERRGTEKSTYDEIYCIDETPIDLSTNPLYTKLLLEGDCD